MDLHQRGQILTEIGTSQAITGQVAQQLTENAPDTTQLTAVLNAIKDGALQISQGARALAAGAKSGSSDPEQYGLYEAAAAAYAGARQLSGTAQQICSAIDTMTDDRNLGALVSGLEQLDEESVQLTAAIGQLSNGADSLKNGARALSDGTKEADNGARTLAGGAQQLKSGAGTLSEGAQQLKTGTAGLLDGAQQLKSGTGTLSEGTQTLLEGTENLKSGAAQLAEGSNDLVEGIKTLDEEAISKIAKLMGSDAGKLYERLSAVLEYAKEKESYTGCPEGIDCTVQYIYKTDGIGE